MADGDIIQSCSRAGAEVALNLHAVHFSFEANIRPIRDRLQS